MRHLQFLIDNNITGSGKKVTTTPKALYNKITAMDKIFFDAFNAKDMTKFKSLFTEDLEWFQDNGGLLSYTAVFENFEKMFKNENKLTRCLVEGNLAVHLVKDYEAIETGRRQFHRSKMKKKKSALLNLLPFGKK